jgi:hypothetical protein
VISSETYANTSLLANKGKTLTCFTNRRKKKREESSVADPDPMPFLLLDPGPGIGFFRIPDPKPIFLRAW